MINRLSGLSKFQYLKLFILILIPITLLILPANYFDSGKSISVFSYFGVEDLVYSTGMTRAIMHLIHFDFNIAWEFNKLSFIVLPLLVLFWLKLCLNTINIRFLSWF